MSNDFPTTQWSQILAARTSDPAELDALVRRYWPPVVAFLRRRGVADAEDVAQETFLRVISARLLDRADASEGQFRHLLLGVTRNVARETRRRDRALKRGGGRRRVPLDPARLPAAPAAGDDDELDRLWLEHVTGLALGRLREESRERGSRHYEALRLRFEDELPYAEIAERLECSLQDVKNGIHRARRRLAALIRDEVRAYARDEDDLVAETGWLSQVYERIAS